MVTIVLWLNGNSCLGTYRVQSGDSKMRVFYIKVKLKLKVLHNVCLSKCYLLKH